jgi:GNAT superfamily N-acetyltransferase
MWSQAQYIYRSDGAGGLIRGAIRKALHPVVAFERFQLLEASLPRPESEACEGITCEVLDRDGVLSLAEMTWADGAQAARRFCSPETPSTRKLAVAVGTRDVVGLCAFEENVVGLPGFRIVPPVPSYFVHFIGVRPDSRGGGIMGQLLACTDRYATKAGARARFCLVASHNKASLRGFAKSGAHRLGAVLVATFLGTPMYIVPRCLRET